MQKFKEGAFLLAKKMKAGIIPVIHSGTEKCFDSTKSKWILAGRADIYIRVLDEIPKETVEEMEMEALVEMVRTRMEEGLGNIEQEILEH